MPQLVLLALLGAGAYAGYRWIARASEELAAEVERQSDLRQRAPGGAIEKDLGALEYDPASGVYRPAKRG